MRIGRRMHARLAAVVTMSASLHGCENWNDDGRTAVRVLLVSDTTLVQRLFDLPYTPQDADATGMALYGTDPEISDFVLSPGSDDLARSATFQVRVTAGPGLLVEGVAPPAHRTVIARMRVVLRRNATRRQIVIFIPGELTRSVRAGPWEILERHPG